MDATSAILAGLLLGFGSAGHCFWSCAVVIGPYLVATEAQPAAVRWSSVPGALHTLLYYHLGRLLSYLAVGLIVSGLALAGARLSSSVQAVALLSLAAVLAYSCLRGANEQRCWPRSKRNAAAFSVGVLQGISPCPPFVAAVGLGLSSGGVVASLLIFFSLFLSTALFTLPLAFLEPLRRKVWLFWVVRGMGLGVSFYLVATAVLLLRV